MRLFIPLLFTLLGTGALAQEAVDVPKQKHDYQSDVTRLRKIVINSLYSHRDVFLRELLSNANDALEKLRLTALTNKDILDPDQQLNITIKAIKDADGPGGRIIITDYGIGMSAEELTTNLGTLAKSGTSEFLDKAENTDGTGQGNLIGAFGLGFYSSFLVADRVYVASAPSRSDPAAASGQHVFSSSADDSSFEVYPDPRGNTLGRGTEITLVLKEDATEFLETDTLKQLVEKHSAFSSAFPIYLYTTKTEEVPDVDADEPKSTSGSEPLSTSTSESDSSTPAQSESRSTDVSTSDSTSAESESRSTDASTSDSTPAESESRSTDASTSDGIPAESSASISTSAAAEEATPKDEDEAIVEDVEDVKIKVHEEEEKPVKMKTVTTEEWVHLNELPPLWTRDPKNVTDEEYINFYKATFKDFDEPLAWHHFSGDSGAGSSFKAILFVPSKLPADFWQGPTITDKDIRLLNKRVFITSDLGEDPMPKWISWIKAVVDAEDLPLNVSRETLQSSRFLKQIKQILIRRLIQLFQRIADEDPEKYDKIVEALGSAIKLGSVEADKKDQQRLAGLARWASNQRNGTSLDAYVKNRKKGQKQIFFLAGLGQSPQMLAKSLFVEKLTARGYEVLLASEPLDEIMFTRLRIWDHLAFQDVAKEGLKFGDEDEDAEEEKEKQKDLVEKFKPLTEWLRNETWMIVMDVSLSNRLVTSPCAIVATMFGYSANMEKLMNAQNTKHGLQHEAAKKRKTLEINPHSPLIQGLLRRVEQLPTEEDERDFESEEELREVTAILIDGALVRSGFDVSDANLFFERVDRVLRRSLGVSESAKTDATVKPAPPVDPEPLVPAASEPPRASIELPEELKGKVSVEMEEIPDDEELPYHDEL